MARSKTLSDEDRILWGRVMRHTKPLKGRAVDAEVPSTTVEKAAVEPAAPAQPASSLKAEAGRPAEGSGRAAPVHHPLERPVKRKIAKGRLELEARLDLHGMFQGEAHFLLLDFIRRAHGRGLRHVLVITGKGTSFGSDGALKRAVPLWFSLPEFRHMISSYEPAARNHGGEGALYVRLARRPGSVP
ncbi:Smr/MutS family protein [Ensifer soli]|uniref:Smr/MutS family protein n=1 Tax=Ciceribacter sp. sgz301302 TaxID=3342379 RepID=UPI0035B70895